MSRKSRRNKESRLASGSGCEKPLQRRLGYRKPHAKQATKDRPIQLSKPFLALLEPDESLRV
jgi:hypothetical protein